MLWPDLYTFQELVILSAAVIFGPRVYSKGSLVIAPHSFYPPDRNFWSTGGSGPLGRAPKSWGGAEDFDEFGKNELEKFSKIE